MRGEVVINKKSIGLKPRVDARTRALILGSFPGRKSLERKEYYANKNNQFWRMISDILGAELESMSYDSKVQFLLEHGIGLWDTVKACRRKGSSDNAIRDAEPNDITKLLAAHTDIKAIFLNGRKAQKELAKNKNILLKTIYLPSTSPLNAGMSFGDKKKAWAKILKFIY